MTGELMGRELVETFYNQFGLGGLCAFKLYGGRIQDFLGSVRHVVMSADAVVNIIDLSAI